MFFVFFKAFTVAYNQLKTLTWKKLLALDAFPGWILFWEHSDANFVIHRTVSTPIVSYHTTQVPVVPSSRPAHRWPILMGILLPYFDSHMELSSSGTFACSKVDVSTPCGVSRPHPVAMHCSGGFFGFLNISGKVQKSLKSVGHETWIPILKRRLAHRLELTTHLYKNWQRNLPRLQGSRRTHTLYMRCYLPQKAILPWKGEPHAWRGCISSL